MSWFLILLYIPFLWDEELFVQSRFSHPLFIALLSSFIWHYPFHILILPVIAITLVFFKRYEMGQSIEIESGLFSAMFFTLFVMFTGNIDGIKTNVPFLSFIISLGISMISIYFKKKIRKYLKGDKYDIYKGITLHTLRYIVSLYVAYFIGYGILHISIDWSKMFLPFYPFILAFVIVSFFDYVKKSVKYKLFYATLLIGLILLLVL